MRISYATGNRAVISFRKTISVAKKKGELSPPASSPRVVQPFSLSSARESLTSRVGNRGEDRATRRDA